MKKTNLETALRQALQGNGETEKMETVVFLARREARRRPARICFRQLLVRQVRFLGWKLWSAQTLVLLVAIWLLEGMYGEPFWDGSVLRLLFSLSALVALTAVPLIYRSVRCRMQEIEAAAYFSSVKLLLARLLVLAVGDLALLLGLFLAAMVRTPLQAGSIWLPLCLPFLVISSGALYMLGHWQARHFFAGTVGLGAAVLLLAAVVPGRYLPGASLVWLLVCGSLLAFCAVELRYLAVRSPYAELQI